MGAPFSILALDFHNTLYDEVMEYGLALDAAVAVWLEVADLRGEAPARQALYAELAEAHRALGSDWDEDAWGLLPSLKNLGLDAGEFENTLARAMAARREKSRQLTTAGAFDGAVETLKALKKKGVRIYVVSEAAADAGMQGISWLGLGGTVDGVYSWPSRKPPLVLENTFHRPFPGRAFDQEHIKKPHPGLLAAVALDDAKYGGKIPGHIRAEEVFSTLRDEKLALSGFPPASPVQNDITARLRVTPGPHEQVLRQTLDDMLYVGDSKFKDGFLARNAGVAFGFAAYGKKIRPGEEAQYERSREILYAVTGWDKDTLKLTQEAGKSEAVRALRPDFTFENTLAEGLPLF